MARQMATVTVARSPFCHPERGCRVAKLAKRASRSDLRASDVSAPLSSSLGRRPLVGVFLNRLVVRIELGLQQQDGGNAPCHIPHLVHLSHLQRALQDFLFTIAKPLLHDLVSADRVFPDFKWNILPVGGIVEIDIEGAIAEECVHIFG